jgi:hypothetical protein
MAVGLPTHEVIIFAQTLEGVHASVAGLMTTKDPIGALALDQHKISKGAKVAVSQYDLTAFEMRAKLMEEALFMIMEIPDALAAHGTSSQRHEGNQAQHGKTAAGFLL